MANIKAIIKKGKKALLLVRSLLMSWHIRIILLTSYKLKNAWGEEKEKFLLFQDVDGKEN
ncbi:CLUMA_CG012523, isoform A [Clunio marinus]|uniref:CLUMA_CG012523, isoform A n=1 Tax=Clunio marinus TaxID=568069 RepID=A0A1J1II04_9DIPT|nr:CLUMA_CG012523, isoform A [Clunio marinus]